MTPFLWFEDDFLNVYTGDNRNYSSNLNLDDISVNFEVSTPAHQRLPWDINSSQSKKPRDNHKPKKRKFVILKTSKLKAFALMFTCLACVVFGFQVFPITIYTDRLN